LRCERDTPLSDLRAAVSVLAFPLGDGGPRRQPNARSRFMELQLTPERIWLDCRERGAPN